VPWHVATKYVYFLFFSPTMTFENVDRGSPLTNVPPSLLESASKVIIRLIIITCMHVFIQVYFIEINLYVSEFTAHQLVSKVIKLFIVFTCTHVYFIKINLLYTLILIRALATKRLIRAVNSPSG
jgi:hypothetical protein